MFGSLFNQKKQEPVVVAQGAQISANVNGQELSASVAAAAPTQPAQNNSLFTGQQPAQTAQPVDPTSLQQASPMQGVSSEINPEQRQNMSALTHLDPRTTQVLVQAQREAARIRQATIEPDQLLYGLLFDADIFNVLTENAVDVTKLSASIQQQEQMGNFTGQPALSEAGKHIFEQALISAKNRSAEFITPEDLLIVLFNDQKANTMLSQGGLKKEQLEQKLAKDPSFTSGKKSNLEKFGRDLTEAARSGQLDPIEGRDREIERVVHILLRRTKNNPIIIGEAGTGKTAIVEGLAQLIVNGTAPKDLINKKIIQIDVSSLVAGASHRGEFEERLRTVIQEAMASSGTVILFIDEIHTLIGAGDQEGALDASNIIKPFLARGQLQLIGTTTTAEYRKYFEKDKAFERRFQPVLCDEPDEETAMKMLEVLKAKYEKFHNVVITPEAIDAAVHLSKRYVGERYLPDKAVDLLDEAAADVRLLKTQGKRQDNQVKKPDIENVVSSWTGIPITKLTENESEKLLHLEDFIHKRLIAQDRAVGAVAEAVRRGRIGLASANRPIASFIFLGPTGTGKTELAKTLAEILFGKDDAMIRLDMSEYMEKHEVAKLIGAPPGYVGYEEGGQLTEAVRAKPYSVVLLDEVEKAHPDVFNILLQLLEDGRLTDNKGNTISFKNTIIIATSNIGSSLIQQTLLEQTKDGKEVSKVKDPKKFEELQSVVMGELRKFFKPELLNRFDEVIMFEPLAPEDMVAITKLGIKKTQKLLSEQGVDLSATDGALAQLAKEGYDPIYGARPLRRLIQTAIENPIAVLLINKTFVAGDTILIDYDKTKGQYVFTKAAPKPKTDQSNQKKTTNQPGQQNAQVPNSQSVQPGLNNTSPQNGQATPAAQVGAEEAVGIAVPAQPSNGVPPMPTASAIPPMPQSIPISQDGTQPQTS